MRGTLPPYVCVSQPYVLADAYNRRTPYIIQYEANLQRQLSDSTVVEIGYLGTQGHRLERYFYYNQAIAGATGTITQRSPYPELGEIATVGNASNSNYHSLSVKLTRRFASGLTYLAGYTWSKSIDNGSGIRTLGADPLFAQNSYCSAAIAACRFLIRASDSSRRCYMLFRSEKAVRCSIEASAAAVLGGWELSSIFTLSTGFPLTVVAGADRSLTGVLFDHADATGAPPTLSGGQRRTAQWFNTAAFAFAPLGTYGSAGRNTLIGPGIAAWDFSTLKNFNLTEKRYLQFRFEAFNLPNHPSWVIRTSRWAIIGWMLPEGPSRLGSFGTITSTRTAMRQLQFSLKLVF